VFKIDQAEWGIKLSRKGITAKENIVQSTENKT